MKRLFLGSDIVVRNPLVKIGRNKIDFGQGFYLASLREQAESWARTIASRIRNHKPLLNISVLRKGLYLRDEG